MHSPKSPTAASDPKTTALEHTTKQIQKREKSCPFKRTRKLGGTKMHHQQQRDTSHLQLSATDYTEGRKTRLIYGH
jgi:hypothetical protein